MALVSRIYGGNTYSGSAIRSAKKKAKQSKAREISNRFRVELVERATAAEVAFQHILVDLHIQYEFQKVFGKKQKNFKIVDFWLPQLRMVVEIDGKYHDSPIQQWKDACRTLKLIQRYRSQVKKVIRFTNDEVLHHPDIVKERLF